MPGIAYAIMLTVCFVQMVFFIERMFAAEKKYKDLYDDIFGPLKPHSLWQVRHYPAERRMEFVVLPEGLRKYDEIVVTIDGKPHRTVSLRGEPEPLPKFKWVRVTSKSLDQAMRQEEKAFDPLTPAKKPWSQKHPRCIDCGTTKRKHASHGRCTKCRHAHDYRR